MDPSYKGKAYDLVIAMNLLEFSVWTKLLIEKRETVKDIIDRFQASFGKMLTKISYKKLVIYDEKQESYK